MRSARWKSILPCAWSTGSMFAFAGILFFLYQKSQYLLFRLSAIFLLLFATVNLLLLLLGHVPKRSMRQDANANESAERAEDGQRHASSFWRTLSARLGHATVRFLIRAQRPAQLVLLTAALIGGFVWFGAVAWATPPVATLAYWHLVVVVTMFIAAVILDKLCKHAKVEEDPFCLSLLRNARAIFNLTKCVTVLLALSLALRILNIYDVQQYAIYILTAFFYYAGVMTLFSLVVRAMRREMGTAPGIVIFLPFLNADIKELELLSFLENNTGITLRSLWSLRFVKSLLPYALIVAALLFWMSSGIVYVQSHQEAAVYRMGHLQEETLQPGLHLCLPYPFDRAEICDTKTVNKITIGYNSTENVDNVWTQAQDEEYKLLLGSGDELVSINLRIEYRISDLRQYLRTAVSPDRVLEAKAYELVTARTINTDLQTILSANRESFASEFYTELSAQIAELGVGLEVVNVIMESIHPPVEIAEVYQAFIGAEIDAQEMILTAKGEAAVLIANGEASSHRQLNNARIDYYDRLSAAKTEVAEFMAAVEASEAFHDEYAYYKYLEAICSAYQRAKLVILGDGVDGTRLYFGNFTQE